MTISVIIPLLNDPDDLTPLLAQLAEQTVEFEVIVVDNGRRHGRSTSIQDQVRPVSVPGAARTTALNAGAAAAKGDILLFLEPDISLSAAALVAIERNLRLLPQAVGGNFHLKFDENTLFTQLLTRLLKRGRYRGHYDGNSGIFVRKEVFDTLGGFRPDPLLADYDLARRMENYGPTLYLPETITASRRQFRGRKLKTVLIWLVIYPLFRLGVYPDRLARHKHPGVPS